MKITGTITAIGMVRSSAADAPNPWECQTFVIEEDAERAPMSVAFDVWDKNKFQFERGEACTVHLDIQAKAGTDGRWFNGIKIWKKEGGNPVQAQAPVAQAAQPQAAQPTAAVAAAQPVAATQPNDPPF